MPLHAVDFEWLSSCAANRSNGFLIDLSKHRTAPCTGESICIHALVCSWLCACMHVYIYVNCFHVCVL